MLAPLQGLIKGKLDQRKRCLEVHWAAARDMKPGQLARMQATLAQWYAQRKRRHSAGSPCSPRADLR